MFSQSTLSATATCKTRAWLPRLGYRAQERLTPYCFLTPSLLALGVVFFYPMAQTVISSLHSNDFGGAARFVGLENYADVLRASWLTRAIAASLLWSIGSVVFVSGLSLLSALMLNRQFRGRSVVRALFILPWAIPWVAAGLVWGWIFDYEFGVLNFLLRAAGLADHNVGFLLACPQALWSLTAVSVWKLYPFGMVMFLAGLQTIPAEYYEAARIDGANALHAFWHVTLPGLKSVIVMLTLLIVIWSFGRTFTVIFLLTEGGPAGCTETVVVRSYLEAFKFLRLGTASAMGIMVLIVSLIFAIAYLSMIYRRSDASA